ncbi:MAG: hypothetical protein GY821_13760 [Gammaproteobacteria bacterium]|nr:hypothetical protein [Gammaproteobacteria bacterium]
MTAPYYFLLIVYSIGYYGHTGTFLSDALVTAYYPLFLPVFLIPLSVMQAMVAVNTALTTPLRGYFPDSS